MIDIRKASVSFGKEILIVGVAALLCALGLQYGRQIQGASQSAVDKRTAVPQVAAGNHITIKGKDKLSKGARVLIIVSERCHFCQQSIEFHRRLILTARGHSLSAFVAIPDLAPAQGYLDSLEVGSADRIRWSDLSLNVPGTPLILLLGSDNTVLSSWLGRLDRNGEERVLHVLAHPEKVLRSTTVRAGEGDSIGLGIPGEITDLEFRRLDPSEHVRLIDIREREEYSAAHRPDAVNVPLAELRARLPYEVDKRSELAVDCSTLSTEKCDLAKGIIAKGRAPKVYALNRNMSGQSCSFTPAQVTATRNQ